jgi:hypothetical protein
LPCTDIAPSPAKFNTESDDAPMAFGVVPPIAGGEARSEASVSLPSVPPLL